LALLSAALGKSVPARLIDSLRRASEQWSRGDKGEPSLNCFTDSKDLVTPKIEFFPICVELIDSTTYKLEQITLACAGHNLNSSRKFNG
jgi:hypothetical protein